MNAWLSRNMQPNKKVHQILLASAPNKHKNTNTRSVTVYKGTCPFNSIEIQVQLTSVCICLSYRVLVSALRKKRGTNRRGRLIEKKKKADGERWKDCNGLVGQSCAILIFSQYIPLPRAFFFWTKRGIIVHWMYDSFCFLLDCYSGKYNIFCIEESQTTRSYFSGFIFLYG